VSEYRFIIVRKLTLLNHLRISWIKILKESSCNSSRMIFNILKLRKSGKSSKVNM